MKTKAKRLFNPTITESHYNETVNDQIINFFEEYPLKLNYFEAYCSNNTLFELSTKINTITAEYEEITFLGFDAIMYEITIPSYFDTAGFSPTAIAFMQKNKGKTVDIPLHIVSVFNINKKIVAGPLFGSILNQALSSGHPLPISYQYAMDRLTEMFIENKYHAVLVSTPYFSRWKCSDVENKYIEAKTQFLLLNHPKAKIAWVDYLCDIQHGKKFTEGRLPYPEEGEKTSLIGVASFHLLTDDIELLSKFNCLENSLDEFFNRVQQVFSYQNSLLDLTLDPIKNNQIIAFMEWLISETTYEMHI